ncbi:hypothetical protein KQI08_11305 [Paraeggerthella hongkongensis]|uniref:DUF6870 family protein n=1 Tax=Paraeggerthella hominis TaxID=2897351 RepID=UPI001C10F5D3|nr:MULTISPECIES: hypothetical protein [Paraeggerthella]MBU5406485.1 hypothetical protein [Paraeggerthella hongkongensis]MCD2434251.1 hypothetical protein [Paraeggerthella hominis]
MNMQKYLEECKQVDVANVDPDTLRDLGDVVIDPALDDEARLLSFIEQIGNPYCYKSDGLVVKLSFANECSLEDALAHYITMRSLDDVKEGDAA